MYEYLLQDVLIYCTTPFTACHQYNTVAVHRCPHLKTGYRLSSLPIPFTFHFTYNTVLYSSIPVQGVLTHSTCTGRSHAQYLYRVSSRTVPVQGVLTYNTFYMVPYHLHYQLQGAFTLTYSTSSEEVVLTYNTCSREPSQVQKLFPAGCPRVHTCNTNVQHNPVNGVY
jgi:hypothetical protein